MEADGVDRADGSNSKLAGWVARDKDTRAGFAGNLDYRTTETDKDSETSSGCVKGGCCFVEQVKEDG